MAGKLMIQEMKTTELASLIQQARPGATIRIPPGHHFLTNVVLDRPVQLIGEGASEQTVLILTTPLQISHENVLLHGLALVGHNPSPVEPIPADCAVYISRGSPNIENCEVTSENGSCIGIEGNQAAPVLRDCRIQGAADSGILISRCAKPVIENCEFDGCRGIGLVAGDLAEPVVRGCRFRNGAGNGLMFRDAAKGIVERCEISAHALSNVVLRKEADPVFRSCSIRYGQQGGAF